MLCYFNILKIISKYGTTSQEENKGGNQFKARQQGSYFQQVTSQSRRVDCMLKVIIFKVLLVPII